jgi:hypothetical protein
VNTENEKAVRTLFEQWWNDKCANMPILDYGYQTLTQDIAFHAFKAALQSQSNTPQDGWKVTRSIIKECPALIVPQTLLQKLGGTAQIIPLPGFTEQAANEMANALNFTPPQQQEHSGEAADATRYRRLRILGAAVYGSQELDKGHVLRFQSLDELLDRDLATFASRGETSPATPTATASQKDAKEAAIRMWNQCGEQILQADNVLRSISSYLGQGGMWDTENLDYDEVEKRIKEGIDVIVEVERKRATASQESAPTSDQTGREPT